MDKRITFVKKFGELKVWYKGSLVVISQTLFSQLTERILIDYFSRKLCCSSATAKGLINECQDVLTK